MGSLEMQGFCYKEQPTEKSLIMANNGLFMHGQRLQDLTATSTEFTNSL